MAQLTLSALRTQIRTSIKGPRLGLDTTPDQVGTVGGSNFRGGLLVGHAGQRLPIQAISATGGSSIFPSGFVELSCTKASSAINTIQAPIPGATVDIYVASTNQSTLGHVIQAPAGVNFATTTGSSANQLTFLQVGAQAELVGISTSLYLCSFYPGASGSSGWVFPSTF